MVQSSHAPHADSQAGVSKKLKGLQKGQNSLQTGQNLEHCQKDNGQKGSNISEQEWPERKALPPLPEGEITQEVGEAYCKQICQLYLKVFDSQKGVFKGAKATMNVKQGHLKKIKQGGLCHTAKVPYGQQDHYEVK